MQIVKLPQMKNLHLTLHVCVNGKLAKSRERKVRVVSKYPLFYSLIAQREKLRPVLPVILATNANELITLPHSAPILRTLTRLGDPSVSSISTLGSNRS